MVVKRKTKKKHTDYSDVRSNLLLRLRKAEGQVRGIQQMIVDDRYCLDVLQQVNALSSALREVAVAVIESHLRASIQDAVSSGDGEASLQEMLTMLRKALQSR